jgi:hypothetical protein
MAAAGKAAYFPGLFSVFTSFEFGIPGVLSLYLSSAFI